MDIFFSYKIGAGAEVAEDESEIPYECYSQIRFEEAENEMSQEELNKHHRELVSCVADTFRVDSKYVIPISNEEYEKKMNEEDHGTSEVLN